MSSARRQLLTLVGLVIVVDALAIGIYQLAGIERASPDLKLGFTLAWTAVTLAVVLTQLRRMRIARTQGRRPARGGRN